MKVWICVLLCAVLLCGCLPDMQMTEPTSSSPTPAFTEPTSTGSTSEPTTEPTSTESTTEPTQPVSGHLVVIDAGHQGKGNYEKEPIGPGATEEKAKVSSGTQGCVTGIEEYRLTLLLAEKLEAELLARGYEVIMIRRSHDVNISNSERANIANENGADAFIRIHANGSEDPEVSGAMTICQTPDNPYNAAYYEKSRALSAAVLDGLVDKTSCKKQFVWETDTMSGINWCMVPVTIVEVGYMSNPAEDRLLATDDYQNRIAIGIAEGVDAYFAQEGAA